MNEMFNNRLCSVVMSFIIMILSGMDAVNTIYILSKGGEELNPLMGMLLERDLSTFLYIKQGVTFLFLGILTWFVEWKALLSILIIYIALLSYQMTLIWSI